MCPMEDNLLSRNTSYFPNCPDFFQKVKDFFYYNIFIL